MKYFILAITLVFSYEINAQNRNNTVQYDKDHGLIISHKIQAGQTVFGLTTHYGFKLDKTIALNSNKDLSLLSLNDEVVFGLNKELLENNLSSTNQTPIKYVVNSDETLYSIARIYANKDVKDLMELNDLSNYQIHPADTLILGYIDTPYTLQTSSNDEDLKPKEITKNVDVVQIVVDTLQSEEIPTTIPEHPAHTSRGMAYWHNIDSSYSDLIVMHKDAPINTAIMLYNPMMKRSIEALVVGSIPEKSYPDNISVVISPAVANALGALDKRFIVEMTY